MNQDLTPFEIAVQRAEKGLAWLRESGPLHGLDVDLVDLDTLLLASSCRCVFGQLGQGYEQVVALLYAKASIPKGMDGFDWLVEHGFDRNWADQTSYAALTQAWRQVLTTDRAIRADA